MKTILRKKWVLLAFLAILGGCSTGDDTETARDTTPPAEISGLGVSPGNQSVVFSWTPPLDEDFDHVEITWSPGGTNALSVPKGTNTKTVASLVNGRTYTFTLKTVDTAGNKSSGINQNSSPAGELPQKHAPWGNPPANGDFSGSAANTIEGHTGMVVITLTLTDGYITAVSSAGTAGQSPNPGEVLLAMLPGLIIGQNSMEIEHPDGITRATLTLNAAKAAGEQALQSIP